MSYFYQTGDEFAKVIAAAAGKTITSVVHDQHCDELDGGSLTLRFEDGTGLRLGDNGQSCCESRYMTCDDILESYVGEKLVSVETADGPDIEDEWGECHDQQFLRVHTTGGTITCANHNEHNGYYGGFSVVAKALEA